MLDPECKDGPEKPSTGASLKMAEADEGIQSLYTITVASYKFTYAWLEDFFQHPTKICLAT